MDVAVSPLIQLLEDGASLKMTMNGPQKPDLVKSPDGSVYSGFADFNTLINSSCVFMPMNSNRAINKTVVAERVKMNRQVLKDTGKYCDFGQINLIVIQDDPTKTFYVMDGQHRCATMMKLLEYREPINFQFRVKVVPTEEDAVKVLEHFQNSYPSDSRAFFKTQKMTKLATEALECIRKKFRSPDLFKEVVVKSRVGATRGDPVRPYLTDFVFFGVLKDSKLLESPDCTVEQVVQGLVDMNELMSNLASDPDDICCLGTGVSKTMVKRAKDMGCFLGLFRPGKLEWAQLKLGLPTSPVASSRSEPFEAERKTKKRKL